MNTKNEKKGLFKKEFLETFGYTALFISGSTLSGVLKLGAGAASVAGVATLGVQSVFLCLFLGAAFATYGISKAVYLGIVKKDPQVFTQNSVKTKARLAAATAMAGLSLVSTFGLGVAFTAAAEKSAQTADAQPSVLVQGSQQALNSRSVAPAIIVQR